MQNNGWQNQISTKPLTVQRSRRVDSKRLLTSGNAGKILPLMYVPLLREDAVQSSRVRFNFEMAETAERLLNGVNVTVNAHFVPFLAFERFNGMDSLNRSYAGQPEADGSVIPFFMTHQIGQGFGGNGAEIYETMGIHGAQGSDVNTSLVEAYNVVVNFRRAQRSKSLPQRTAFDGTLAEAFWHHTAMKHIVPDFDQAMIDGEVALNVVEGKMPVQGIYHMDDGRGSLVGTNTAATDGSMGDPYVTQDTWRALAAESGAAEIFAEMQQNGITVSLSNIDMAKKTAAFARARQKYQGHDDEFIIDLLMSGVRVPEQALKQPILLAQKSTLFGYSQRYASDGANLEKSVTTGETFIDLALRIPQMNTGGIVLITAEITPEQLFERQKDHWMHATDVAQLPEYTRDYLDPEKVSIVTNDHVDVDHSDPDSTFGYAPLNHEWMRQGPNIGGKFFRPEVDAAFDEDRQRIWAVETTDPELTTDFYLCTQMHQKVFADTEADAFEISGAGEFQITGNTVFGPALQEATDDFEKVLETVDQTRIEKE